MGPACRRPSRPVVQLEELLLVCVSGVWVCYVVTGMVQVPAYHGGADRRPSNRRVTQSDDDSHTRARS